MCIHRSDGVQGGVTMSPHLGFLYEFLYLVIFRLSVQGLLISGGFPNRGSVNSHVNSHVNLQGTDAGNRSFGVPKTIT